MIDALVTKVGNRQDLTADEAEFLFSEIALGHVAPQVISTFLVALAHKKETAQEITGAARAMRKFVTRIHTKSPAVIDTCGTGGDRKGTFNVSTATALVVAGAGVTVAKHGNRSVSSSCGSADLMEAFGVAIDVEPPVIERCLDEVGIAFLFAPKLHPAMAHVQPVRRALKQRTIFNILGPLINPAFPSCQLVGIYEEALVPVIAAALSALGMKHAMVACGEGGLDEVTTTGKTLVAEVKDGHVRELVLEPEKFDLPRADIRDIIGESVETNKRIAMNILKGMEGPERDVVLLNAGCALYVADHCHTIKEGIAQARESLDSGAAIKKLNKLIECTHS